MTANPPEGRDPAIRTIAMPADANANGDIFGGWMMAQMDLAGAVVAVRRAKGRVATVAVEAMPNARVSAATAAKPGLPERVRRANRRS